MARYNSALASTTISGTATVGSPYGGAFTEFTGTAPYTVTLPSPVAFPGANQTFYNATSPSGTVTLSTPAGIFTGTGGSNASTVLCFAGNVLSVTSDGTNYVVISEDGSALTATTGSFSGDVTMNGSGALVSLTPQNVTITPSSISNINNMNIGATTRGSGAFTSLAANAAVAFTANTASTTTGTGSLVVTGGVGVSGQVTATSISATNLTGTLQTAAQANITSTGDLTTPSLTTALLTISKSLASTTTAQQMLVINTDYGSAIGTGFGGAIVFRGRTPGNILQDNAQILAYNEDANDNGYALGFFTRPNVASGLQQRVTILRGGTVGIGTTSPQYKLHVAGATTYSATDDAATVLKVASTTSRYPTFPGEATAIAITKTGEKFGWRMLSHYVADTYSGMDFHLQVSADATPTWSTKLYVAGQTGNVGIGTTDFSAGYTFNVAKRARFNGMMLGNGDGSNAADNRIGLDWASGSYAQIVAQQNVPLYLGVGGATKVALDSGGHWLPLTNDSQNLGSATQAWGNIFTNDLHLCNETKVNGNDVDGTTGNWTIQEGAEDLYIINNKTGKKYAFALREIE